MLRTAYHYRSDIKKNMKSLLIVLTVLATLTALLTTTRTFIIKDRNEAYGTELKYIDTVSGLIASKISYDYELSKICLKQKNAFLDANLAADFQYYFRKEVETRIQLEAEAPRIRSRLGEDITQRYIQFFILMNSTYVDVPSEYCKIYKGKALDWKLLKDKQLEFTSISVDYINKRFSYVTQ